MRTIHDYDHKTDAALEEAYQQGLRDGRATKPLKWRTDKVPMSLSPGDEVFYKAFIDGIGDWYGVGVGVGEGKIEGEGVFVYHGDYLWLLLSEILELVEDNDGYRRKEGRDELRKTTT